MPDKNAFDRYLLALRKTALDEKTEHTDRAALEALLQAFADEADIRFVGKGLKQCFKSGPLVVCPLCHRAQSSSNASK